MYRSGPGVRPTEEDRERRRHVDVVSLARCQRRNEERCVKGLRIAAWVVEPPPPPPPPQPDVPDDRCSMTVEEAQHHLDNVPVAPPLTGQMGLDYIGTLWQAEVDVAVME